MYYSVLLIFFFSNVGQATVNFFFAAIFYLSFFSVNHTCFKNFLLQKILIKNILLSVSRDNSYRKKSLSCIS